MIERHTSRNGAKPLKVIVKHSHVVAHQTFALRILGWFEGLLEQSGAVRDLFAHAIEDLLVC